MFSISALTATPPARALSRAAFERLMQAVEADVPEGPLGIAVSGGPDSMALLVLLQEWANARSRDVLAFTVDHGLRTTSAFEARRVADWCRIWGIPHTTLHWEKESVPQSALHALARKARYNLLFTAAKKQGCRSLFFAQHRQDQAETVLMRLARGTGIDGAAGMPLVSMREGITLLRPLLPATKEMLIATCEARNVPFVRDPSNELTRFKRGELRAKEEALAKAGLGTERIYNFACAAAATRAQLEAEANQWLTQHAAITPFGILRIKQAAFFACAHDMQTRILTRALLCLSGEEYPPRSESLENILAQLAASLFAVATLSGCRIENRQEHITFMREEKACAQTAVPLSRSAEGTQWDNRFRIMVDPKLNFENISVRALGSTSREQLKKMGLENIASLPARMRATLPALFVGDTLVCVPEFVGASQQSQSPVTACFSPKNPLLVTPFRATQPLSSLFGVV